MHKGAEKRQSGGRWEKWKFLISSEIVLSELSCTQCLLSRQTPVPSVRKLTVAKKHPNYSINQNEPKLNFSECSFLKIPLTVWEPIVNINLILWSSVQLHYADCHHFVTQNIYPRYIVTPNSRNCRSWKNKRALYCNLPIAVSSSNRAQLSLHYSVWMNTIKFCIPAAWYQYQKKHKAECILVAKYSLSLCPLNAVPIKSSVYHY